MSEPTNRQRMILLAAFTIERGAREVGGARDVYKEMIEGKSKEYDTLDEAEDELRRAVDDLQCFIHDFNKAVR